MSDARKKAQAFVDAVRSSGTTVTSASLFGSHARGTATEDSDIDVCIVSPQFGRDYIEEMVQLRKIALTIDSRIEPVPLAPEDVVDRLATLPSEIRAYGMSLK